MKRAYYLCQQTLINSDHNKRIQPTFPKQHPDDRMVGCSCYLAKSNRYISYAIFATEANFPNIWILRYVATVLFLSEIHLPAQRARTQARKIA